MHTNMRSCTVDRSQSLGGPVRAFEQDDANGSWYTPCGAVFEAVQIQRNPAMLVNRLEAWSDQDNVIYR